MVPALSSSVLPGASPSPGAPRRAAPPDYRSRKASCSASQPRRGESSWLCATRHHERWAPAPDEFRANRHCWSRGHHEPDAHRHRHASAEHAHRHRHTSAEYAHWHRVTHASKHEPRGRGPSRSDESVADDGRSSASRLCGTNHRSRSRRRRSDAYELRSAIPTKQHGRESASDELLAHEQRRAADIAQFFQNFDQPSLGQPIT